MPLGPAVFDDARQSSSILVADLSYHAAAGRASDDSGKDEATVVLCRCGLRSKGRGRRVDGVSADAPVRDLELGQISAEPAQRPADDRPLMPLTIHDQAPRPTQFVAQPAGDRRSQRVLPGAGLLMQEMRAP
jgi:hypothetical protein